MTICKHKGLSHCCEFNIACFASNELTKKNEAIYQHKPGNINEKTFMCRIQCNAKTL